MTASEIKQNFHELIDKAENEHLLDQFYHAFEYSLRNSRDELWDSLTDEERDEVLQAYEESFTNENLVKYDEVREKHSRWRSKHELHDPR